MKLFVLDFAVRSKACHSWMYFHYGFSNAHNFWMTDLLDDYRRALVKETITMQMREKKGGTCATGKPFLRWLTWENTYVRQSYKFSGGLEMRPD
ncbi:MAG: hypothetical protein SGJ17_00675 [Hyphomicrobiales bacterium]|nr:hypothetical protein [Hyphomicrobiales bacterium]